MYRPSHTRAQQCIVRPRDASLQRVAPKAEGDGQSEACETAYKLTRKGKFKDAEKVLSRQALTYPSALVLLNLSAVLAEQKKYRDALPIARRAVEMWETSREGLATLPAAVFNLAVILEGNKDYTRAIQQYRRSIAFAIEWAPDLVKEFKSACALAVDAHKIRRSKMLGGGRSRLRSGGRVIPISPLLTVDSEVDDFKEEMEQIRKRQIELHQRRKIKKTGRPGKLRTDLHEKLNRLCAAQSPSPSSPGGTYTDSLSSRRSPFGHGSPLSDLSSEVTKEWFEDTSLADLAQQNGRTGEYIESWSQSGDSVNAFVFEQHYSPCNESACSGRAKSPRSPFKSSCRSRTSPRAACLKLSDDIFRSSEGTSLVGISRESPSVNRHVCSPFEIELKPVSKPRKTESKKGATPEKLSQHKKPQKMAPAGNKGHVVEVFFFDIPMTPRTADDTVPRPPPTTPEYVMPENFELDFKMLQKALNGLQEQQISEPSQLAPSRELNEEISEVFDPISPVSHIEGQEEEAYFKTPSYQPKSPQLGDFFSQIDEANIHVSRVHQAVDTIASTIEILHHNDQFLYSEPSDPTSKDQVLYDLSVSLDRLQQQLLKKETNQS